MENTERRQWNCPAYRHRSHFNIGLAPETNLIGTQVCFHGAS